MKLCNYFSFFKFRSGVVHIIQPLKKKQLTLGKESIELVKLSLMVFSVVMKL